LNGYSGDDCSTLIIANGYFVDGQLKCLPGYKGDRC